VDMAVLKEDMEAPRVDMVVRRAAMVDLKEDMEVLREDTEDLPRVTLSSNNRYVSKTISDQIELVHSYSPSAFQVYVQQPPRKSGGGGTGCLACLAGVSRFSCITG